MEAVFGWVATYGYGALFGLLVLGIVGLPIPAGALTLASIINYAPEPVTDKRFAAIMLLVTAALAFAMVSTVRYRSQKYANLQKRLSATYVLLGVLLLAVLWRWPAEFCFLWMISYVSSGPLIKLWSIAFPSRRTPAPPGPGYVPTAELPITEG